MAKQADDHSSSTQAAYEFFSILLDVYEETVVDLTISLESDQLGFKDFLFHAEKKLRSSFSFVCLVRMTLQKKK